MKNKIACILLFIVICIGIMLGFKSIGKKEYIRQGEARNIDFSTWDSTIADNINKSAIVLNVDGRKIENDECLFYMSDTMTLMLPANIITDVFDCAINMYNNDTLVIEKGTTKLRLVKDSLSMMKNEELINLDHSFAIEDNHLYIPIDALKKGLEYDYSWNSGKNTAVLTSGNPNQVSLPPYYNYEENGRAPNVKDQGKFGTCWAFASLTALESSLLPEESYDFSPDHMSLHNPYNISQNEGGDYAMSIAYLASWKGPVLEEDDPYGDGKTTEGLKAVKHLQEVQFIKSKDYETIKKMVYKYGGVQSSLYTSMVNNYNKASYAYNKNTKSYCYMGTKKPNHDVVIIGWDDNYPKENFSVDLEGDGAFICRNSWGSGFGNNGSFYVSYYDSVIGVNNVVYTKIEENTNYQNIYQSDLCGWVGQLGYGGDSAYFANAYTSKEAEELKAVSFYATDRDTEYSIYVCEDFKERESLNILGAPVVSGKFTNGGYYTVNLKESISIKAGQKYAVIVKITTPNSSRPIAIEYVNDQKTSKVDLGDGEGYISLSGFNWENTEEKYGCNLCLKVFTNNLK